MSGLHHVELRPRSLRYYTTERLQRLSRYSATGFADSRRKLVRASVTFPGLPVRGASDVVRADVTEAPIACQNHTSVVAVLERVILAVPIHTTRAQ